MKRTSLFFPLILFTVWATAQVRSLHDSSTVCIYNDQLSLILNIKQGIFDVKDKEGVVVLSKAYFQLNGLLSKDSADARNWMVKPVADSLGTGSALILTVSFAHYADLYWKVTLYDHQDFLVFDMGVLPRTGAPFRIQSFSPLQCNDVFPGSDHQQNYKVLDGNDGGNQTRIRTENHVASFNNLLVRFGPLDKPDILVAGGLSYHDFEKFVRIDRKKEKLLLSLSGSDPIGRLVSSQQPYWMDDAFYVCFANKNPFAALEKYATVLKKRQHIHLNYYDFPTECLWYASYYNRDTARRKFNDTRGAVQEMKNAVASGITRYTRVAIRLVPDAYGPDNQQGWWDDKHWAMWGGDASAEEANYVAPFLTTKSWCKAIEEQGGLPFTYFQSGRRSEDFARAHPNWMLFNDPYRVKIDKDRVLLPLDVIGPAYKGHSNYWWTNKMLWGYDFTDSGFTAHMHQVYAHLKRAGIKGMMFDYPYNTAWNYAGGFDDPYATTAGTYRKMFELAYEGLGSDSYIHERNLLRGSDITLGLVASQRVWADNDVITAEMIGRCGLRWYKNRVVLNYDMDAKDPDKARPLHSPDGYRAMFTMCYVVSGRFLLGRSFSQLTPQQIHALSRVFPFPGKPLSFRPVDAFTGNHPWPRVYDCQLSADWHNLIFYNENADSLQTTDNTIAVGLGQSMNAGGLQLDTSQSYYVYDYWNDRLVGRYKGTDTLRQQLRPGEARVMSIHALATHPQVLSTNRHIMQGAFDLKACRWDSSTQTLTGTSAVIGDDVYKVVIATNGYRLKAAPTSTGNAAVSVAENTDSTITLTLKAAESTQVDWNLHFKNK